ncbi:nuclear transport factor 2 family protein, partial [Nocardia seriolae]
MGPAIDAIAITNLIARYAELVDAGDFTGVGTLLADATFHGGGGSIHGGTAIAKMLRAMVIRYEDGTPKTHHVTTNTILEFNDSTATARSYFTVFQSLPILPLQPIAAGRYHDTFQNTTGHWQFTERRVEITMTGNLTHHLNTP